MMYIQMALSEPATPCSCLSWGDLVSSLHFGVASELRLAKSHQSIGMRIARIVIDARVPEGTESVSRQ